MFYREVEVSDCMLTLFRGNLLGSKIMAFCFKIYGATFLQGLLEPLIQEMIDNTDGVSFEVDPARMESTEVLEENQRNLAQITQRVFNAIVSSTNRFPPQLRSMCHCLFKVSRTTLAQLALYCFSDLLTLLLFPLMRWV